MKSVCAKLGLVLEEWEENEGFEKSFVPEKVLSGTGAGDTSIAAFLVSTLEGSSFTGMVRTKKRPQGTTGAGTGE